VLIVEKADNKKRNQLQRHEEHEDTKKEEEIGVTPPQKLLPAPIVHPGGVIPRGGVHP
jgi:hypothetical protein